MTKKAWKSIPNELVHLGLIGHHSPRRDALCNITDKTLKEILQRSHQLNSFECELDVLQKGVSEESLQHISKIKNITTLKIQLYIPFFSKLEWIVNLRNLKNLDLRVRNFPVVKANKLVIQICRNLQQLQTLTLGGLRVAEASFTEIHLLINLTKLSIYTLSSLRTCRIFHFIKNVHTLRELCFDGYTFPKLTKRYTMSNAQRREICEDIAVLNQLLNLRKIEVECADDYCDISSLIVQGLCKEKKWIHQCQDIFHTFFNTFSQQH